MRFPWHRSRDAEDAVEVARRALEKAKRDRELALRLAEQARDLRRTNGFAQAIRQAMGEHRP